MTTIAIADEVTASTQARFTGADPEALPGELRSIIEASITHAPRSQQTLIGPSEIGVECERCLTHKLAQTPSMREAAWLPHVGTAMHELLERTFLQHEMTRIALGMPERFLPECRVNIGEIGGTPITGSTDLFDLHSGTVIDWKLVGTTTLRKVRAHGASLQYQRQAHSYGKGWEDAGYTVKSVLIYFLPRNAVSLSDAYPWQATYDRQVALDALTRANQIHDRIVGFGAPAAIAMTPEHTGDDFSCRSYPDYRAAVRPIDSSDPFGS